MNTVLCHPTKQNKTKQQPCASIVKIQTKQQVNILQTENMNNDNSSLKN